jgi:cyclopropane fatty-acyl-phospholipid synthase-like methyltransferase
MARPADAGYGCGEQDLFWWRRFPVREIVGVTLEPVQHAVAQAKVRRAGLDEHIRLYCGRCAWAAQAGA